MSGRTAPARRAAGWTLALFAFAGIAHAQVAGTLGVDSVNRYRGTGTSDVGPVLHASAMADASWGGYAGLAGLWRTRDARLASASALVGASGRLNDWPALATVSPDWGWDAGVRRTHYGSGYARRDFTEAMLGLLTPQATLRTWYAPRYFGGSTHAYYTELDGSHAVDEHWRVFAHAGWLHYGPAPAYQARVGDRVDTLVGIGFARDAWDLRLSRDGLVSGHARQDLDARQRRPAWTLGASIAF